MIFKYDKNTSNSEILLDIVLSDGINHDIYNNDVSL